MRLSDIMSAAGRSSWAEVALVIFVVAFVAIAATLLVRGRGDYDQKMSRMPLEEGEPVDHGAKKEISSDG